MSAKDNFAQAFKELLSGTDTDVPQESAAPSLNTEQNMAAERADERVSSPPVLSPAPSYENGNVSGYGTSAYNTSAQAQPSTAPATPTAPVKEKSTGFAGFGGFGRKAPAADSYSSTPAADSYSSSYGFGGSDSSGGDGGSRDPQDATTTIAFGTVVIGEIHSKGDMNLYGEIKGNVETSGNVVLGGRVMGNIIGNDMTISTSAVKGNIAAAGSMSVDSGSVVLGDLKAHDAQFDGQVKGNLTVDGLAHFLSDTVLLGNVSVGSLIIDEGARLHGEICTGSRDRFDIADPFQS